MPSDNDNLINSEILSFIFRRIGIVVFTFIIIVNIICAYIFSRPPDYQSQATISYSIVEQAQVARGWDVKDELISERQESIAKVFLSENCRKIIHKVWPEVNEKEDPIRFSQLMGSLRNPSGGIQFQQNDATDIGTVIVSYISSDALLSYKVVQAAVDTIIDNNEKTSDEKLQQAVDFFKQQEDFHKKEIDGINNELATLKSELLTQFPHLSPEDRASIMDVVKEKPSTQDQSVSLTANYQEMITQLHLDLVTAQKKRLSLLEKRARKNSSDEGSSSDDFLKDFFLHQYANDLKLKQSQLQILLNSGYQPDHPQVKELQEEIDHINRLKEARITELQESTSSDENGVDVDQTNKDISDLDLQIDTIKAKLDTIKKDFQDATAGSATVSSTDLSAKVARFNDLNNERDISEKTLLDIRSKLEDAELKVRMGGKDQGLVISVEEEAQIPVSPISMRKFKFLMMGVFLALAVGLVAAYIWDSFDSPIRTKNELSQFLGVPVIGTIDCFSSSEYMAGEKKKWIRLAIIVVVLLLLTDFLIIKMIH